MASKKKLVLSVVALTFILLCITLSIIAVFAAQQVSLTSNVSVTYIADKITGTAKASYSLDGGATFINDQTSDIATNGSAGWNDTINLDSSQPTIIYKYEFKNTSTNICYASVDLSGVTKTNCTVTYSLDKDGYYKSANVGVVLNASGSDTQDYYIKVTFDTNTSEDSVFSGSMVWDLSLNRDTFYKFNGTETSAGSGRYYYGLYPQSYSYSESDTLSKANGEGVIDEYLEKKLTGWSYSRGYNTSFAKTKYEEYVLGGSLYVYTGVAYKVQPIEWLKEGNEYTSYRALGYSVWDDNSVEWKGSLLQSWLNEDFYTETGLNKINIADTELDLSTTGFTQASTDKIYVCKNKAREFISEVSNSNFAQLDNNLDVTNYWVMQKDSATNVMSRNAGYDSGGYFYEDVGSSAYTSANEVVCSFTLAN